jgi:hypothetical protein
LGDETTSDDSITVLDPNDNLEFWRYIHEFNRNENTHQGLLRFLEKFFTDYNVNEIKVDDLQEITVKIRDRLVNLANNIFSFIEANGEFIKPEAMSLLEQINRTLKQMPQMKIFKVGKIREVGQNGLIETDGEEDSNQINDNDTDDAINIDNRIQADKILRALSSHIKSEKSCLVDILGNDNGDSDNKENILKQIKLLVGNKMTKYDIQKALNYFIQKKM